MIALLSLTGLLLLGAFVCCVLAATNRLHLWVAVMLIILANLLGLGVAVR